jgi:hypothetical protein
MSSFIHNYIQNRVPRPTNPETPLDHNGADIAVVLTALTLVAHEPLIHPTARRLAEDAVQRLGPGASENVRRHVGNWVQNRMIEGLNAFYKSNAAMPATHSPIVNEAGRRAVALLEHQGRGTSALAAGLRAALQRQDNNAIATGVRWCNQPPSIPSVDDDFKPQNA